MSLEAASPERVAAPRRRLVLLAAVLVLAAALLLLRGWSATEDTAWASGAPYSTLYRLDVDESQAWMLGGIFIDADGVGQHLRIVEVEAAVSDNIEQLGVYGVLPGAQHAHGTVVAGPDFPTEGVTDHLDPVIGRTITARELSVTDPAWPDNRIDLQLLLGFRVLEGSVGGVNGVRVEYEVDGRRQERVFAEAMLACVRPTACPEDSDAALRELGLLR